MSASRRRRRAETLRFRRSKHLVAYWDGPVLRVRNYATGRHARIQGDACAVLDQYDSWKTAEEASQGLSTARPAEVLEVSERLSEQGFLLRSDQMPIAAEEAMDRFDAWNPAVGLFHSATRDVRFGSLGAGQTVQRRAAANDPWAGKSFVPPGVAIPLPQPQPDSAVERVFLRRRSWRRFASRPLGLPELSSLLWLTGGIPQWACTELGAFALKTSPSGGALHPIELYVLARNVSGLRGGVYHYAGSEHVLRLMTRHTRRVRIEQYLPEQPWFEGAAVVLFLVAHYDRSLWRYRYPRAYRAPYIEAGHLAQTFCVRATEIGLAPFVSMALADTAIEQEIGADGVTRSVLYATGVGVRPKGLRWAPLPEGEGSLSIRRNPILRHRRAP